MGDLRVSYSDPGWAVDAAGHIDAARADVEREILGAEARIDLGLRRADRFVVDGSDFVNYLRGSDAIVVYRARLTAAVLEGIGPRCRVFARQGVGIDNLDLEAIKAYGAFAFNVPDYCVDETSTHALGLLLTAERDILQQDTIVRGGGWPTRSGRIPIRLAESTLGIVGFGRIGRAFARKAAPLFERIISYDPAVHPDLVIGHGVTPVDGLEELFARAEVISLHASLTLESTSLVAAPLLSLMRPGALLVNTARGRLIDNEDLLAALESGRLGGYATDVYHPEPPEDDPATRRICRHPRVISTAHRGFLSHSSDKSVRSRVAEELAYVLRTGRPPRYGRIV